MRNTPKLKTEYQQHKPTLRKQFSYRCAYCETRESELGGSRSFGIDHYKPKNKFPHLINVLDNLLYVCNECNSYKGSYWPTLLQKSLGEYILNLRTHNIDSHLDKNDFAWQGKTNTGKWNISRLRLSSERRIQTRKDRKNFQGILENLKKAYIELQCKHDNTIETEKRTDIQTELQQYPEQIETIERTLNGVME